MTPHSSRNWLATAGWSIALACLVLGVRLFVFDYAGSPLPYYDQWLAEFNNTFGQLIHGQSAWAVLTIRHNEHLMVTTKAASLAGCLLNGYWDVAFLVAVAALVRALEAALLFRLLTNGAGRTGHIVAWAACVAVFVAPVSGFNLLCGLQVSFYFAELAAIGAIACVVGWRGPWRSGAGLVLMTGFGLISMGSAVAIPLATLATHLAARQPRRGFWPAWALSVAAAGAFVATMATGRAAAIPLLTKLRFGLEILAWPFSSPLVGLAVVLLAAATLVWAWRRRILQRGPCPAIVGFGVFAGANALLIAANRPPSDFHLRHWDTVAIVPLTLAVLAANLIAAAGHQRRKIAYVAAAGAAAYAGMFALQIKDESWTYIEGARAHRAEALAYYRRILPSRQILTEADRINDMLRRQDYRFFDDPILRFTPHPLAFLTIASAPLPTLSLLSPEILPLRPPSRLSVAIHAAMHGGLYIAGLGVLIALASAVLVDVGAPARRRTQPPGEAAAESVGRTKDAS